MYKLLATALIVIMGSAAALAEVTLAEKREACLAELRMAIQQAVKRDGSYNEDAVMACAYVGYLTDADFDEVIAAVKAAKPN